MLEVRRHRIVHCIYRHEPRVVFHESQKSRARQCCDLSYTDTILECEYRLTFKENSINKRVNIQEELESVSAPALLFECVLLRLYCVYRQISWIENKATLSATKSQRPHI